MYQEGREERMDNITLSNTEKERLKIILSDPVLWAKAFVVARNPETGQTGPWLARDYQAEILRNRDVRKVYRMGRRLWKNRVDGSRCLMANLYA